MRSHSSEHRDSLPVLDVTALRHIAYVLDGIVFYMRSGKENDLDKHDINAWTDLDENENDDTEDELQLDGDDFADNVVYLVGSSQGRRQSFFQRSESTLCLGCPPPDPFNTPMCESLPLADQPHLLQPNARREDLFGIPKQPITIPSNGNEPPGVNSPLELPPTQLGLSPHKNLNINEASLSSLSSASTFSPNTNPEYENSTQFMENNTDVVVVSGDQPVETMELGNDEEVKSIIEPGGSSSSSSNEVVKIAKVSEIEPQPIIVASTSAASTSKEPGNKRKLTDHSDSFGNIYMQLKKKNYYDQYDEDNRNYEKKDEGPQDLSCSKEEPDLRVKMDIDTDSEGSVDWQNTQSEMDLAVVHNQPQQVASDDPSMNRPQIIVTPRKVAAAIESVTAAVLAKNNKNTLSECASTDTPLNLLPTTFSVFEINAGASTSSTGEGTSNSNVIAQGGSSSGSPSKSVIVRAGPSVSFILIFLFVSF